jgi:MFS family permease
MYTFVLMWTPSLNSAVRSENPDATIPHGYIFATFMVAIMIGSSAFKLLTRICKVENFMRYVLLLSAICLLVPIILPTSLFSVYFAFVIFEFCVGIFWPAMGMMRGKYVPESARSTTMNLFRIPLNLIVILVLMQNVSPTLIFSFCVAFLLCAVSAQFFLYGYLLDCYHL